MAKKKRTTGPAKPAGKGPMAVNKSATPAWMRMVIIAVVISFSAGGVAIVAATLGNSGAAGSADSIAATYQAKVKSAQDVLATDPDDPASMANVGHAYFEWAVALYESGQQPASIAVWDKAVQQYDQVLAITPDDDIVLGNKAFALYYAAVSGSDADAALAPEAMRKFIDAASDNASLAQQVADMTGLLAQLEAAQASQPVTTTP